MSRVILNILACYICMASTLAFADATTPPPLPSPMTAEEIARRDRSDASSTIHESQEAISELDYQISLLISASQYGVTVGYTSAPISIAPFQNEVDAYVGAVLLAIDDYELGCEFMEIAYENWDSPTLNGIFTSASSKFNQAYLNSKSIPANVIARSNAVALQAIDLNLAIGAWLNSGNGGT